jgi:hypothetical protein
MHLHCIEEELEAIIPIVEAYTQLTSCVGLTIRFFVVSGVSKSNFSEVFSEFRLWHWLAQIRIF